VWQRARAVGGERYAAAWGVLEACGVVLRLGPSRLMLSFPPSPVPCHVLRLQCVWGVWGCGVGGVGGPRGHRQAGAGGGGWGWGVGWVWGRGEGNNHPTAGRRENAQVASAGGAVCVAQFLQVFAATRKKPRCVV